MHVNINAICPQNVDIFKVKFVLKYFNNQAKMGKP